jgi:hypothetical protein
MQTNIKVANQNLPNPQIHNSGEYPDPSLMVMPNQTSVHLFPYFAPLPDKVDFGGHFLDMCLAVR